MHASPSALCPHIEWAVGGVLGVAVDLSWTPQPAKVGAYRAELSWSGPSGTGAGSRRRCAAGSTCFSKSRRTRRRPVKAPAIPSRRSSALFHAVTGLHGDIMIPEDRLKAAVVKSAIGDLPLLAEIDKLLGKTWDESLEPFRHAGEGAPVRWLHHVV